MRGSFAAVAKEMLVKIDAVKETMTNATNTYFPPILYGLSIVYEFCLV